MHTLSLINLMKHAYLILLLARLAVFGQVAYQPTVEEQEQIELVEKKKSGKIDPVSFFTACQSEVRMLSIARLQTIYRP
jgi:hypothetical protein